MGTHRAGHASLGEGLNGNVGGRLDGVQGVRGEGGVGVLAKGVQMGDFGVLKRGGKDGVGEESARLLQGLADRRQGVVVDGDAVGPLACVMRREM